MVGLAVAVLGFAAVGLATSGPGTAWIDAPLSGVVIGPVSAPIDVTTHATDPDGIVIVRLDVNGSTVETVATDGSTLVDVRFKWSPPAAGTYGLSVWGQDSGGEWSAPGVATVTVLDRGTDPDSGLTTTTTAPSGATTTTISTTTTPPTATTIPCDPALIAPVLSSPANGVGVPAATGSTLSWSYPGCGPVTHFQVQLSFTNLFGRIELEGSADVGTTFDTGPLEECRVYYWRVQARYNDQAGPWSSVWSFPTTTRTPCP